MEKMLKQEQYMKNIQEIDKDHLASLFMALCESNGVYSEDEFYVFIYDILYGEQA